MNAVTQISQPESPQGDSMVNFVGVMLARFPDMSFQQLESVLRMQRDMVAEDARLQFNRAMSATQAEMAPVIRDAQNDQTHSRYARLETIDAAIRPIYTRHGFCLTFDTEPTDGTAIELVCEVSHSAGHTKLFGLPGELDVNGPRGNANKSALHALGSTLSYLRRYLTCLVFHVTLTNDDNDGNRRAPEPGRLTQDQVDTLHDMMRATRTEEGRFLIAMCPGLRSISQAPAADFPRLQNALLTKANVLKQRAEAARAAAAKEQRDAADRAAAARQTPKGETRH